MPKEYAVYKHLTFQDGETQVTRMADNVQAESDYAAIVATTGNHMLGSTGALRYNGDFFRTYGDRLVDSVRYFAGEVC